MCHHIGNETCGSLLPLSLCFVPTLRKSPFVVQGGRQKVLVSVTLENKKENAYNTSLSLSFSRNLHLTSLTPQVPWRRETGAKEERRRETRTSAMGCCGQKCGSSPLPALTSASIPLPSEGQISEGGVRSPFPPRPALHRGASSLPGWGQGEYGFRMRTRC